MPVSLRIPLEKEKKIRKAAACQWESKSVPIMGK